MDRRRQTSGETTPARVAEVSETRNRILAALPSDEFAQIAPRLDRLYLAPRDVLFDVNKPIEHVYFPESCVASIIGLTADGSAVETATIGDEGVVGLPVFHGTDRTTLQAFCQVPGEAVRMPVDVFRAEIARSEKLTRLLHLYSQALLTLIAQSSACNRLHSMQQRCARWLLHTHDRVGYARGVHEFSLTQQFLSQMLGVRRATVSQAMSALQETGGIAYEMGRIRVLDRARLEASACECYGIVRSEFDRLLQATRDQSPVPNPLDRLKTSDHGKTLVGDAVPRQDEPSRIE
jgi:CRP-like cAMP-binding protein